MLKTVSLQPKTAWKKILGSDFFEHGQDGNPVWKIALDYERKLSIVRLNYRGWISNCNKIPLISGVSLLI